MSSVNLVVIRFAVRILYRLQIKETSFETFLFFSKIWCILSLFLKLFYGVKYFKKPPLIDSLNLKTVGNERLLYEKLKYHSLNTFKCIDQTIIRININNSSQIISGDDV